MLSAGIHLALLSLSRKREATISRNAYRRLNSYRVIVSLDWVANTRFYGARLSHCSVLLTSRFSFTDMNSPVTWFVASAYRIPWCHLLSAWRYFLLYRVLPTHSTDAEPNVVYFQFSWHFDLLPSPLRSRSASWHETCETTSGIKLGKLLFFLTRHSCLAFFYPSPSHIITVAPTLSL